ncbi:MAG TPA: hypothetical protein VF438_00365 [Candidatus Paceibacterota bacterium]
MNKGFITQLAGIGLASAAIAMPFVAYAQTQQNLKSIIALIVDYIEQGMFLMMAVAVLVFIWQVIRYFILPNEDRKEAGQYVMYSVIGFFVIFSLWGLVNVVSATFNIGDNAQNSPRSWTNIKSIFPTSSGT